MQRASIIKKIVGLKMMRSILNLIEVQLNLEVAPKMVKKIICRTRFKTPIKLVIAFKVEA